MGLLGLFRRQPTDTEAARRTRLLTTGRIAEGTIFDVGADDAGAVTQMFYRYEIGGVEYESSQVLDESQRTHTAHYYPGARVTIRFDPRQPANSLVV